VRARRAKVVLVARAERVVHAVRAVAVAGAVDAVAVAAAAVVDCVLDKPVFCFQYVYLFAVYAISDIFSRHYICIHTSYVALYDL
jgi:hypothetical protein